MATALPSFGNPININLGGFSPKGIYNSATTYNTGDVVSYNSSSYIAKIESTGNMPTNLTYWQVLAEGILGPTGPQGLQGAQGEKGDVGDDGPQGIQGEKGDMGLQGIQGVKGDTGDTGPQGAQGIAGTQGPSGNDTSIINALIFG